MLGPFPGFSSKITLRGMDYVYVETQREQDPAVQAGRNEFEILFFENRLTRILSWFETFLCSRNATNGASRCYFQ